MINRQNLHQLLKKSIGQERYIHSLGVMKTAKRLSIKYGCNVEKAEITGLLHDCGRMEKSECLLKRIIEFDIILDNVMKKNVNLIHGPLGAEIARREYNVTDKEILDAIKYHTIGRANMTLLEKIIYVSDYIEPGRFFPGVEDARKLAEESIDNALLFSMNNTIKYVIKKGLLLHPDTIRARNFLINNINI